MPSDKHRQFYEIRADRSSVLAQVTRYFERALGGYRWKVSWFLNVHRPGETFEKFSDVAETVTRVMNDRGFPSWEWWQIFKREEGQPMPVVNPQHEMEKAEDLREEVQSRIAATLDGARRAAEIKNLYRHFEMEVNNWSGELECSGDLAEARELVASIRQSGIAALLGKDLEGNPAGYALAVVLFDTMDSIA